MVKCMVTLFLAANCWNAESAVAFSMNRFKILSICSLSEAALTVGCGVISGVLPSGITGSKVAAVVAGAAAMFFCRSLTAGPPADAKFANSSSLGSRRAPVQLKLSNAALFRA